MSLENHKINLLQDYILARIHQEPFLKRANKENFENECDYPVLIEDIFFKTFRNSGQFDYELYLRIEKENPYLWKRIPQIIQFGFYQGRIFHELRNSDKESATKVAIASAVLNLTIVLYDYIIDECPLIDLESIVNSKIIYQLLGEKQELAIQMLSSKAIATPFPIIHLLLCSMITWVKFLKKLPAPKADSMQFRNHLYNQIGSMFQAELRTKNLDFSEGNIQETLFQKSVGPSLAICHLSFLSIPPSSIQEEVLYLNLADVTGQIFSIVDDLCDIQIDLKQQAPNRFIYTAFNNETVKLRKETRFFSLRTEVEKGLRNLSENFLNVQNILNASKASEDIKHTYLQWLAIWVQSWATPKNSI